MRRAFALRHTSSVTWAWTYSGMATVVTSPLLDDRITIFSMVSYFPGAWHSPVSTPSLPDGCQIGFTPAVIGRSAPHTYRRVLVENTKKSLLGSPHRVRYIAFFPSSFCSFLCDAPVAVPQCSSHLHTPEIPCSNCMSSGAAIWRWDQDFLSWKLSNNPNFASQDGNNCPAPSIWILKVEEMKRHISHFSSNRDGALREIRIRAVGWVRIFRIGAFACSSSFAFPNNRHSGTWGSSSNSILANGDSYIADQISWSFNPLNLNSLPIIALRIAHISEIQDPSFVERSSNNFFCDDTDN